MTSYLDGHGTRQTPQSEKIPGSKQVENSAGGFSYELDDFARLRRFLILGTEGGTYYAGQRELTLENADVVRRCLKEDAKRTIGEIKTISESGRAPKNDPAIFALAIAAADQEDETRSLALSQLRLVCRTGTHLFQFVDFLEQFRGWGRGARRAVAEWYDRDDLAYQLVKYRQRGGWTHRDVLRLAHPEPKTDAQKVAFAYVTEKQADVSGSVAGLESLTAFERAQRAETPAETVALIKEFGGKLPREALKTEHLADPEVWKALIPRTPITALIRNLGTMTRNGALKPLAPEVAEVVSTITDEERLIKGRVHPISVLAALKTYQAGGRGGRGRGEPYKPLGPIVDALDDAFYKAFGAVEVTGKSIMLAIDISGSMTWENLMGIPGLDPRTAAGALAMVTQKTEPNTLVTVFSSGPGRSRWSNTHDLGSGITPVDISSRKRLDDVIRTINSLQMGGTDCALPMLYAVQEELPVDAFVVYTDNETWAGDVHPSQALVEYRRKLNRPAAKLVVVGMTATEFSIADPDDAGMLDVVGFDTATPQLISEFISA